MTGSAKRRTAEHAPGGSDGLLDALRQHHALARRQPIGLDHQRCTHLADEGFGGIGIGEALVAGRGDGMPGQEILGKGLGTFQLRRRLPGSKAGQARRREQIADAQNQRHFRADDGQIDMMRLGKPEQVRRIIGGDRYIGHLGFQGGARIARRDVDIADPAGLRHLPGQGMFAATAANDQDIHTCTPQPQSSPAGRCGMLLVPEMPHAGKHHRHAVLIGGSDHLGIAHRPARLHHGSNTKLGSGVDAIAEREKGIGGHH